MRYEFIGQTKRREPDRLDTFFPQCFEYGTSKPALDDTFFEGKEHRALPGKLFQHGSVERLDEPCIDHRNINPFLGEFVNIVPWAHIDIAGTADTDKETPWRAAGATGFGVRLVLEYLMDRTG